MRDIKECIFLAKEQFSIPFTKQFHVQNLYSVKKKTQNELFNLTNVQMLHTLLKCLTIIT